MPQHKNEDSHVLNICRNSEEWKTNTNPVQMPQFSFIFLLHN